MSRCNTLTKDVSVYKKYCLFMYRRLLPHSGPDCLYTVGGIVFFIAARWRDRWYVGTPSAALACVYVADYP